MSFRDNLQHLRATRNMTQEQLAMLLGVSRQSVSKWEAERAYPEMDKLLKLCDLFGCTLDELVLGDLTVRPTDVVFSMPSGKAPQDVTGYDQEMRAFAWKLSLGVSVLLVGTSLDMFLLGLASVPGIDSWNYGGVMMLIASIVALALILPAAFERRAFRKAHPFVADFYTIEQKSHARSVKLTGIVVGVGIIIAGLVVLIVLQTIEWLSSAIFLLLVAVGVFVIIRGYLLESRCNLTKYNQKSLLGMDESEINALDDEGLQAHARQAKRESSMYRIVMSSATAIGLVLLFVPALNAQRWFWLAWPVGGLLCAAISAFRSLRNGA